MSKSTPAVVQVVQVGPSSESQGGIASVQEEYLQANWPEAIRMAAVPTWWPGRPIRSVCAAAVLIVGLIFRRYRRSVLHVHLSEGGSFLREGLVVIAGSYLSAGVVVTLHGADFGDTSERFPRTVRMVLGHANTIVCLGETTRSQVRNIAPSVVARIVLNPAKRQPDSANSIAGLGDRKTVLFAGEVGTRKGFDRLAIAWTRVVARYSDAQLVAIGPLAEDFSFPNLPNCTYLGRLPRDQVMAQICSASVGILPSRREVLPMFIMECVSMRTPVVATEAGEYSSFRNCPSISWVPQYDNEERIIEGLEKEVEALLELGTDDYLKLTRAGELWFSENASVESVVPALASIYFSVVSRKSNDRSR